MNELDAEISSDYSAGEERVFEQGALIARRYRVVRFLGRGAAGAVYLCHELNDPTALKAIKVLFDFSVDSIIFERFYREAKVARRIQSPHVVRSFDLIMDDGTFAYTMEYVDGCSLDAVLLETPQPSLKLIIKALSEIGEGLVAIHEHGLVHRDLKPQNILISKGGHFKITDFGVVHQARELSIRAQKVSIYERLKSALQSIRGEASRKLTDQGVILGTVDYLSPEYVEYDMLDERSDIYSLGVLAFQMIAGRVPFDTGGMMQRLQARVKMPAPSISELRPDVPIQLCELIMKCIERNPRERPQSAKEYLDILKRFCSLADYKQEKTMLDENNAVK